MKSHRIRWTSAGLCAATLLVAACCAISAAAAGEISPRGQLVDLCRAAKSEFRPLADADLRAVQADLADALARLDKRLAADGENGATWRKYLHSDRLRAQVAKGRTPDVAVLDDVYTRYTADHEGLDLVWFVDVRETLRRYHDMARSVGNAAMEANYERLIDFLAVHLETYLAKPTAEEAMVIGQVVRQLEELRQAPDLVAAIRHDLSRPNLRLIVSARLVAAGIAEPVDETAPVREVILKTDVYGTGHTVGQVSAELADDPNRGLIETILRADVDTRNVGYHGPVRIYSSGAAHLVARKQIWIDELGLHSRPATSDATMRTTITAIQARNGNRLIEKFAWKKAAKQRCEAECIAARLAERRVNQRMDRQTAELLDQANRDYAAKFRRPLVERNLFPRQLRFTTTADALQIVALQADAMQLGASAPALLPEGEFDLAVCMHESMVGNLAASALSGTTLDQESLEETLVSLLGELPEQARADEDQRDWAITFPRTQQPISVRFADGGYSITIRGQRFFQGGESYPGMEIAVEYKIERTEQGFKAVRQGDLQIVPLRVASAENRQLSSREVVIRTLLQRRFGKVFAEEMIGKGLVPPGKWSAAGTLNPVVLTCEDGWLTVAWQCAAPEQPSEKPTLADARANR